MANNTCYAKSKAQGLASSLRATPANSPIPRPPPRSPNKSPLHQSVLSLQSILGTTTTSPSGFSSHDGSRSFALCAGSTAVLADLDCENNINQRFFRARPSAASINPVISFYGQSTPPVTPGTRQRSLSNLKLNSNGSFLNGIPSNDTVIESSSPKAWSSREKVKAVTSVSISPNGRFLAVGETGYNPRVLIFSTTKDSQLDVPLTILNEHTVGVRSMAFTTDSKYLATLGDVNDGFLFVWMINLRNGSAKLHSTNRCTSFVRGMCWMGQTLITTGVRHIKAWRIAETPLGSPSRVRTNADSTVNLNQAPRALSGRNCLLGSLADNTFTCVVSISDHEAVIGTESGILCFLDDRNQCQKLSEVKHVGYGIMSLATDFGQSVLWIGDREGKIQKIHFESLRSLAASAAPSFEALDISAGSWGSRGPAITCIGSLSSHLVTVDAARTIRVYPMDTLTAEGEGGRVQMTISAHRDPVLGIAPLETPNNLDASFFTWSSKGKINFWDTRGKCKGSRTVDLDQLPSSDDGLPNELKVLRTTQGMRFFVSGDRRGVLKVLSGRSWECVSETRVHEGEVTDIAVESGQDSCLIASAGRDRMVQLFRGHGESFQLMQTMDDHVGAVTQLLFINHGQKLLSCSADRTILVRERVTRGIDGKGTVAYVISKVITLKSSPISMTLPPDNRDMLIASTVDRCIQKLDIVSGRHIHTFRAADTDAGDTVVMDSLTIAAEVPGQSPKLLIGVSSTDKSIRVYDFERDSLLTGEFGHASGVSDVLLLENGPENPEAPPRRTLVSAGMDGIVMIWDLHVLPCSQDGTQGKTREEDSNTMKESPASKLPLRRILSRSELAGFQRQDNLPATPTPMRDQQRTLRKTPSRPTLISFSRSGNMDSPSSRLPPTRFPAAHFAHAEKVRRSPSPASPESGKPRKPCSVGCNSSHISSLNFKSHDRSNGKTEPATLDASTEQVCRALRTYRKRLNGSHEHLYGGKILERELSLTLRAIRSRSNLHGNAETETDSSGKENRASHNRSIKPSIRKTSSTPNIGQKSLRRVSRCRSLDADGEG